MTERLEKAVIDQAFDNARIFLLGRQQKNSTNSDVYIPDEVTKTFELKGGARICFHLAKYFKAINSVEQAKQLFRKAIKMGEKGEGEAYKLLDEITKMQKTKSVTSQPSKEDAIMVVDDPPSKP